MRPFWTYLRCFLAGIAAVVVFQFVRMSRWANGMGVDTSRYFAWKSSSPLWWFEIVAVFIAVSSLSYFLQRSLRRGRS